MTFGPDMRTGRLTITCDTEMDITSESAEMGKFWEQA